MITKNDILRQLDQASIGHGIPNLNLYYPVAMRMSAYRSEHHWGLVMESFHFNDSCFGHGCATTSLYCFGDVLPQASGWSNPCLSVTGDGPSGRLFDPSGIEQLIMPSARDMTIRGQVVPVTTNVQEYAQAGIKLREWPRIRGYELLRLLVPKCQALVFATEAELGERLGEKMPLRLRLYEWRHCGDDIETPSDCEAFQMIADAIAHNDPSRYRPSQPPNTHWSNWPDAPVV